MRLDPNYIRQLSGLPIAAVAERLGLELHRGLTHCLWHPDKHPSLTFSPRRNTCHCYVCGETADPIKLVQKVRGVGFLEACAWLASGESLPAAHVPSQVDAETGRSQRVDVTFLTELIRYPYLNAEAQRFLYDERRIDPRVVRWCRLTSINSPMPCYRGGRAFYDAPSLLIPYLDAEGRLLSVQSRYLGQAEGVPRFRFPRGSNCPVFNLPVLSRLTGDDELLITEGVSDCLAALSSGRKAIAIGSATLLRDQDLISALTPHFAHWSGPLGIYPDQDAAGEALYHQLLRLSIGLGRPLLRHPLPPSIKYYGQYFASLQP